MIWVFQTAYDLQYIITQPQTRHYKDENACQWQCPTLAMTTSCCCRGGAPVVHACGQQHCAGGRCGVPAQAGGAGCGQGPGQEARRPGQHAEQNRTDKKDKKERKRTGKG